MLWHRDSLSLLSCTPIVMISLEDGDWMEVGQKGVDVLGMSVEVCRIVDNVMTLAMRVNDC